MVHIYMSHLANELINHCVITQNTHIYALFQLQRALKYNLERYSRRHIFVLAPRFIAIVHKVDDNFATCSLKKKNNFAT